MGGGGRRGIGAQIVFYQSVDVSTQSTVWEHYCLSRCALGLGEGSNVPARRKGNSTMGGSGVSHDPPDLCSDVQVSIISSIWTPGTPRPVYI